MLCTLGVDGAHENHRRLHQQQDLGRQRDGHGKCDLEQEHEGHAAFTDSLTMHDPHEGDPARWSWGGGGVVNRGEVSRVDAAGGQQP